MTAVQNRVQTSMIKAVNGQSTEVKTNSPNRIFDLDSVLLFEDLLTVVLRS